MVTKFRINEISDPILQLLFKFVLTLPNFFQFLIFSSRRFFVTNPTNTAYPYQWIQDSIDGTLSGLNTNLVCNTPKGVIEPGKKTEMVFEYRVETMDLVETFWRFVVENQSVSVPFLMVGYGSEPNVSLDRSHVNFKEILIGKLLYPFELHGQI